MNPNAPFPPGGGPQGAPPWGPYMHHDAWWQSGFHLLPLLLLAILIGVLVWGVLRLSSQGAFASAAVAPTPPAGPPPRDQALEELRVRYARGELDRSDLLERSADLGGPPTPDATFPGQPPAEEQG